MIINNILNLSEDELNHISLLYELDVLELIKAINNIDYNKLEKDIKIMLYNMRREIIEIDK